MSLPSGISLDDLATAAVLECEKRQDPKPVETTTTTTTTTTTQISKEALAKIVQQQQNAFGPLIKHVSVLKPVSPLPVGMDKEIRKMGSSILKNKSVRITGPKCSGKTTLIYKFLQEVKSGKIPALAGRGIFMFDLVSAISENAKEVSKMNTIFVNSLLYIKNFQQFLELTEQTKRYGTNFLPLINVLLQSKNTYLLVETEDEKPFPLIDEFFEKIATPSFSEEELRACFKDLHKIFREEESCKTISTLALQFAPKNPLKFVVEITTQLLAERQVDANLETPLSKEEVFAAVAEKEGILQELLKKERLSVEERLSQKVSGQPLAVKAALQALRRIAANLHDPRAPSAVLLFAGPSDVRKRELAKAMAEELFGSLQDHFIQTRMGSCLEKTLICALKDKPRSVVFLEEVENAHPDALRWLLRLFEEGRMVSSSGEIIDARQAVFVMASNVGQDVFTKANSGSIEGVESDLERVLGPALEKIFTPQGYNKIHQVIPFYPMENEDVGSFT